MVPLYSDQVEVLLQPVRQQVRRVLLISYHFPPVGGAGVQRPVKFVKYLRHYGWEASVLTAENPSVPVFDESLCADLPEDLLVTRARTWEPEYRVKQDLGRHGHWSPSVLGKCRQVIRNVTRGAAGLVLQPDPQILWLPGALKRAGRLLNDVPHHAILATAPPFSNLILGGLLKKHTGLPLIVDFRDEWDLSNRYLENSSRNWVSRRFQEFLQGRVLRRADAIVATTELSHKRLQEKAILAGSRASARCIYNGFDESDFPEPQIRETPRSPQSRRFRLVYTGTLWNLTSIEPLVCAIERLNRETPELLDALELVVVGRKTPEQQQFLNRIAQTRCALRCNDYCDHDRALELVRTADGLCLLLSDVPGSERVAPAKLFEYLARGAPILAITPPGETAGLVRKYYPDGHFLPRNVRGVADWLTDRITLFQWTGEDEPVEAPSFDIDAFSRREQTRQLSEVLDRLVK